MTLLERVQCGPTQCHRLSHYYHIVGDSMSLLLILHNLSDPFRLTSWLAGCKLPSWGLQWWGRFFHPTGGLYPTGARRGGRAVLRVWYQPPLPQVRFCPHWGGRVCPQRFVFQFQTNMLAHVQYSVWQFKRHDCVDLVAHQMFVIAKWPVLIL